MTNDARQLPEIAFGFRAFAVIMLGSIEARLTLRQAK